MSERHANAQPCLSPPRNPGSAAGSSTKRIRVHPVAPSTWPTRRYSGGTWSVPASSPLAIDGTAPSRMTAYIVASVSWNQMIAAGTQATDGSDCRPVMIGPNARRSSGEAASAIPIATPTTTDIAKPTAARCTLRETARHAEPSWMVPRRVCHVSAGLGSAYGGLSSSR